MAPHVWHSLVAETQFATELALTGLRRLCSVPAGQAADAWGSDDLNYALHVGMYSYASGLERLCKLAIACHGHGTTGQFPRLRGYSHKIGGLLDAVETLSIPESGASARKSAFLARPIDDLDPGLTSMIERFANGAGRYEHLDSLWNDDAEVSTFTEWSALARGLEVSDDVRDLLSLRWAVSRAIESELISDGLECAAGAALDDLDVTFYEPSVSVMLRLFRKVRWVSVILDLATDQQRPGIPVLGEVVSPIFIHSTRDFFSYHVARLGDENVVRSELEGAYERINAREIEDEDAECVEESWRED
ncbi:hypothetical protein [Cellulomonas soli]|uniref:Uncharacterized protein n=1 Tax=Cellulomonas soli TaxID=931535 RepID=A0A512PHK9_9CELL|nr:hypothetical protein [Cellulomonas soli]NYI59172.1 hypothetical protein [Cellulomonas soli]GEP70676.1 hypothetical protein CSO01_33910 [Cellulomonas soli]